MCKGARKIDTSSRVGAIHSGLVINEKGYRLIQQEIVNLFDFRALVSICYLNKCKWKKYRKYDSMNSKVKEGKVNECKI